MTTTLLPLLLALAASPNADLWVPAECPGPPPAEWAAFEKEVRTAIPSSTVYVPKPFPRTDEDVITDLHHVYFRIWGQSKRSELPEDEITIFDGLRAGSLRFQVAPVVDWTPARCLWRRPQDFQFLIRLFQGAEEVARFSLQMSGHLAEYNSAPDEPAQLQRWQKVLLGLEEAASEVRVRYGVKGTRAQYVSTAAGTVRCFPSQPCVAFQAAGKMYVLDPAPWGGLYELQADGPGLTVEEIKAKARRGPGATAEGVDVEKEGLISVGYRWVYAKKLQPLAAER